MQRSNMLNGDKRFTDMVVNVTLAATSASAGTVPSLPAFVGASDQGYYSDADATFSGSVPSTTYGKISGTQDTTNGIYMSYAHDYVDLQGTRQAVGAAATNFVRYAEYPGQRLFRNVKFEVNGENNYCR